MSDISQHGGIISMRKSTGVPSMSFSQMIYLVQLHLKTAKEMQARLSVTEIIWN